MGHRPPARPEHGDARHVRLRGRLSAAAPLPAVPEGARVPGGVPCLRTGCTHRSGRSPSQTREPLPRGRERACQGGLRRSHPRRAVAAPATPGRPRSRTSPKLHRPGRRPAIGHARGARPGLAGRPERPPVSGKPGCREFLGMLCLPLTHEVTDHKNWSYDQDQRIRLQGAMPRYSR